MQGRTILSVVMMMRRDTGVKTEVSRKININNGLTRISRGVFVCLTAGAMLLAPIDAGRDSLLAPGLTPAFADDDDGDDGGGGGGYGGAGGNSPAGAHRGTGNLGNVSPRGIFRGIRRAITGRTVPRRSATRAAPVALPVRVDRELIAAGVSAPQRVELVAIGYSVVTETDVPLLGTTVMKLRVPEGTSLDTAREQVRSLAVGADVDFNHFYRPEAGEADTCSGPHCAAPQLVGWPSSVGERACGQGVRIALVDTGINPDHAVFEGRSIDLVRIGDDGLEASGQQHGTAVAALLAGSADSRTPGLLPNAELVAIDAFHRARGNGNDDRSDAYTLVRALDAALAREVSVVNLSLAGPANDLLKRAVTVASDRAVVVAAVGNEGPNAEPAFPAAYPGVIGVTAVDHGKRVYRRAGRGEQVDIAAPGVDVWTAASVSGGRPKTGTSFAAPFVTAAVALLKASEPALTTAQVKARLSQSAQDLGDEGRDPVFGWGLLDASDFCAGGEPPSVKAPTAPAVAETVQP